MIKKIIIFIIIVLAAAFIADYYGIIDISLFKGKPKVFETRDDFLYKSQKKIDSEVK